MKTWLDMDGTLALMLTLFKIHQPGINVSTSPFQLSPLYYILSAQLKLRAAKYAFQHSWISFHSVWHTVYVKK